jgi:hypothetical protein
MKSYSVSKLMDRCGIPDRAYEGIPPSRLMINSRNGVMSDDGDSMGASLRMDEDADEGADEGAGPFSAIKAAA